MSAYLAKVLFYFFLGLLIMAPDRGFAFISLKEMEENLILAGHRVEYDANETVFVCYNDLIINSSQRVKFLSPQSNFFIAMDTVSLEFPVSVFLYSHITVTHTIDNMLYANLKLNQLVEEYKKLQTRSKQAIEKIEKLSSKESNHDFREKSLSSTIYRDVMRINRCFVPSTRLVAMVSQSSIGTSAENKNSTFRSGVDLVNKGAWSDFRPSFKEPSDHRSLDSIAKDSSEKHRKVSADEQTQVTKKKVTDLNKKISDGSAVLQFINRIFNNIIPYVITHNLEIVLFIVFLYFMLWFASLVFRR